jgi:osmoprotectant transport system ATP-binding protein
VPFVASIPAVPGDAAPKSPRTTSRAASVEFREVTKRFPGQSEPAIRSLSLEVPAGDICVLVGPSGCGKTTALRLTNRMIELSGGDILLDGVSIRTRPAAELRRGIGYVIQQIGLFPHLTIGENIAVVPKLLDWSRQRISARVGELLELVSLPGDMRDRYPAQLSGGQRQRVGVARALAADPPVMLMDEPFGAIDPINRERLQNQFLRLQSELQKTILFVTHDIDEAIKMGDRVAVMQKGGVLAQYATPPELLMSPASDFVEDFVGADRALKRLALLRVRNIDLWKAPLARVGEPTSAVRARIAEADLPHPLAVDAEGRPVGWLSERDLARETVPAKPDTAPEPIVDRDDVLRDALSDLLRYDTQYGPVVDEHGRVVGVLSVEIISHFLSSNRAAELATGPAERVTG